MSIIPAHAQIERPSTLSVYQHYPSPAKDTAPGSVVAKPALATMTATSPANGTSAMPYAQHSDGDSPRTSSTPKTVSFELIFDESPQIRARLPLRVSIYRHDATDSIVTTVKNFYGLYSGPSVSKGVSFEDEQGHTLIARYENFRNNMVVYVRVFEEEQATFSPHSFQPTPAASHSHSNGDSYPLQAPHHQGGQHISRPTSRTSRVRSPSPNGGRGRRSTSASTNPNATKKGRSRSSKTRAPGVHSVGDIHSDGLAGYSSGDGAPGSRAKFESSELPLFAPPQMPAATSNQSVSPARRIEHPRASLPFIQPGQNPFSNPRPLQSPQSYNGYAHPGMYATPAVDDRRTRGSFGYSAGTSVGPRASMMPTPDPTVGSCMSEEDKDVAMQLMRLGEMANMSHGRTSASTLDDTFSGIADAASSTGATSDSDSGSEEELPPARRQKLDALGNHKKLLHTTESHFIGPQESVEAGGDDADYEGGTEHGAMAAPRTKNSKPKSGGSLNGSKPRSQSSNKVRTSKSSSKPKVKKSGSLGPMTPASLPASRKQSLVSNPALPLVPGEDDQPDLSTKPRCQRCRKSKKGCDRQRPCGRCRDAGIPAEQCISEDEGNGRKGRYGRHMGVPLKKDDGSVASVPTALLPAAPIAAAAAADPHPSAAAATATAATSASITAPVAIDKSKKRKR
ncbi:hypothetical protein B0T17DRAFT_586916 [Bombardia bombarda]|uniref:Zn(2)-C6 fungal-type domain-containing protein n=1 Tax=Bombardia bombarda TaxID=252184 RepID=A0AA39XJX7_9PEZI|nr:hypothetical protein B0T17DRAFT_586916 [Bombardia bombarda]